MAACSASWRTSSFTDLESMTTAPQIANYRPKEKVGENPPDNASEDPSKLWIIREGRGGSKRGAGAGSPPSDQPLLNCEWKRKAGLISNRRRRRSRLRRRRVLFDQLLRP